MEHNEYKVYLSKEERMQTVLSFVPEAVVVGNGEFPSHPFPLSVLDQAPCVVCCDGGTNALVESGRVPSWIVGDGDSLSEENRIRFQDRIHRVPDQETNDQTKAVSFLASQGIRRIAILGATGKREDHTLGNISLLMEYQQMGLEVVMLTDYGFLFRLWIHRFLPDSRTNRCLSSISMRCSCGVKG